jgi:hypothetical protein
MESSTSESTPQRGGVSDRPQQRREMPPHLDLDAVAPPDYWHPGPEEFAGLRAASPSKVILLVVLRWRS